jgi:hypothetical protein
VFSIALKNNGIKMKKLKSFLIVSSLLFVCSSPQQSTSGGSSSSQPQIAPNEIRIARQDFGNAWPFTVEEGVLSCKGKGGVGEVVLTANGTTYALNGVAKGTKKYRPIDDIWAENPSLAGTKKDIGPIIERGLKLCK